MAPPADALVVTAEIAVDDADDPGGDVDHERWRLLAEQALRTEGVTGGELHLVFVDEATMAELNETHMGVEGPTDVLAFPLDEPGADAVGGPVLLGDVIVCAPVAARNAPERVDDELALLVVHGVLHVLGHDHVDDDETRLMREREQALLAAHHRPCE
jgi:probable rRNA maturation factor